MATNSQTNVDTALDLALKKITEVEVPQAKHIALAYWGGLDPTLCVKLSHLKYRARKLTAITVDVGQGETELQESTERAAKLGIAPIVIDAKQEFTHRWLGKAIHANSDYNGYPVATSMTRQLIAAHVAKKALELGCDALMEYYSVAVEEVITGGDDKTMWCRSIASGGIDLSTGLPDSIWMWLTPPAKAPDKPTTLTLSWQNGLPVALNDEQLPLDQIIEQLDFIGEANGIGKIDLFEDGIMGMKSREIYVELYKGNIDIRARSSSSGLFFPDIRSIKSASFNQQECAPAAHLRGLPFELIARRNNYWGEQS